MVENQICLSFMLSHVLSCTKISNKVITNNFISNNFITNNIITFLSVITQTIKAAIHGWKAA